MAKIKLEKIVSTFLTTLFVPAVSASILLMINEDSKQLSDAGHYPLYLMITAGVYSFIDASHKFLTEINRE